MKQARLPFKVLPAKTTQISESQIHSTFAQNALKKRKLSDTAPGPAKASKNPRNDENQHKTSKTIAGTKQVDGAENEVSSSSETENLQKPAPEPTPPAKEKKHGIMDMFLRTTQQLEVSTTNNIDSSGLEETEQPETSMSPDSVNGNPTIEIVLDCDSEHDIKTVQKCTVAIEKIKVKCDSTAECSSGNIVTKIGEGNKDGENKSSENADSANDSKVNESGDVNMSFSSANNSLTEDNDSSVIKSPSGSGDKKDSPSNKANKPKLNSKKLAEREAEKKKREEKRLAEKEEKRLQKLKEIEERNKQKQLEKEKKDKEKEEARIKREQEKKEKLEQKEKEKQEKLKQKEEEKKKKEEERLKKMEEKNKELEEKQRLKDEKEQQEQKSKEFGKKVIEKQKTFLSSFFTKKEKDAQNEKFEASSNGIFQQFPMKDDMRLAPLSRVDMESKLDSLRELDEVMPNQDTEKLYVKELQEKKFTPGSSERTWPCTDTDVMIVSDESDKKPEKKLMRAKYFLFHENYRPPYYGTWTKSSSKIHARNPFAKDTDFLDYEVDSDDEWEEEEPGESVSDSGGEDDDDKVPNDDDEEDDGFFVPHGYLSEDEGCEDDDEDVTPERMKARQIARAKAFEADMNSKTQVLKPTVIGCVWLQSDEKQNDPALEILKRFQVVPLVESPIDLVMEDKAESKKDKTKKDTKLGDRKYPQLQAVPEEAMEDLLHLVHGNVCGMRYLVKEFREFWRRKESGDDVSALNTTQDSQDGDAEMAMDTSQNESTVKEEAAKYSISKRQLEKTIKDIGVYEKRGTMRHCWYVNNDILTKYNLTDLPVPSEWTWVTQEPVNLKASKLSTSDLSAVAEPKTRSPTPTQGLTSNKEGNIMKFAKPGISPKFPIVSPKPVVPLNSTPLMIRTAPSNTSTPLLNQNAAASENTPKRSGFKPKGNPSSLFKPVEAVEEDTDCSIVEFESPLPLKPDKNQRTLTAMFGVAPADTAKTLPSSPQVITTKADSSILDTTPNRSLNTQKKVDSTKSDTTPKRSIQQNAATSQKADSSKKATTTTTPNRSVKSAAAKNLVKTPTNPTTNVRRKSTEEKKRKSNNCLLSPKPVSRLESIVSALNKSENVHSPTKIVKLLSKAAEEDRLNISGSGSVDSPMEID